MKSGFLASAIIALAFAGNCSAATIDFEDAYFALGYTGKPTNFYAAQGLTIPNTNYFGILAGVSRGDPGNFDLEGTNGPASLAVNTIGHVIDLNFDTTVDLSLDLGIDFGETSDITVNTYNNGQLISSNPMSLTDTLNNGLGTWYPLAWSGVDRVELQATSGWRAWAIDNLQFAPVAVPEPASIAIWSALGVAGFIGARRRRKNA